MTTPPSNTTRSVFSNNCDEELVDSGISSKYITTPMCVLPNSEPQFTPDDEERDATVVGGTTKRDEQGTQRSFFDRQREDQESLELAQRLMAEEAMASYQNHFDLLRDSADHLSQEDFDALQQALEEDEEEHVAALENEEGDLSYDTLLQLGERMGNVKSERWAMKAQQEVAKLPTFTFDKNALPNDGEHVEDSEIKCLVCQCEYEEYDQLRRLPCNHCFHVDCVDQWLKEKDACPYCRQCIVNPEK